MTVIKAIHLSAAEAEELADYAKLIGVPEAALLREAVLRGLREIRLSRGILAYLEGAPIEEAAHVAGLPRALFLDALMEKGVPVLRGPSSTGTELGAMLAAETALP